MRMLIVFCLVVLFAASQGRVRDARDSYIFKLMEMKKLPSPKLTASLEGITTAYYDQILDHFKPEDERRWRQRYYVNDEYFKDIEHGPVFLLIGGEGEAGIGWMRSGAWYQYAREVGALMIQLEHRFYGKSYAAPNMSIENLQYLTSEQAIQDIATFINFVKESFQIPNNKWVSFGGSYPGSLSIWIRSKHPELIAGAIGSSGPVKAKVDFEEYLGVVEKDMNIRNENCRPAMLQALEVIQIIINGEEGGWTRIEKLFGLCPGSSEENEKDIQNFMLSLLGMFYNAAQYDSFLSFNVDYACHVLTNSHFGATELERLAKLTKSFYGDTCINVNYVDMIKEMKEDQWIMSPESVGYRQWYYQTCNEFGWYQTGNLWGDFSPVNFFIDTCIDVYGSQFYGAAVYDNAKRINALYGGKTPEITNAIITQGSFDPWHPMGILEDLNESVQTFIIEGAAHCYDLYESSDSESAQMKEIRNITLESIKKWIS